MKKLIVASLAMVLTAGPAFSFGLPKIPSVGSEKSAASAVSIEDALASQADLVKAYSKGVKFNLQTQGLMAEALGLKTEAAKLIAAAEGIQEGNVEGIEATKAETAAVSETVEKKMSEGSELSGESKKTVAKSLGTMALSLLSYRNAADKTQSSLQMAKSVIENAPMTQKLSAKNQLDSVLKVAPKIPGDLSNVVMTAKKYVDFAKSAGVAPPADLNTALGDL